MIESRSGLRVTGPIGDQLRVALDDRAGFELADLQLDGHERLQEAVIEEQVHYCPVK